MADDHFKVTIGDGAARIEGDLDMGTADLLRLVLLPYAGRKITIDMSGSAFIDSTGLQALLAFRRADTTLEVVNSSASVRRVFELSSLVEELGVV